MGFAGSYDKDIASHRVPFLLANGPPGGSSDYIGDLVVVVFEWKEYSG